MAKLKERRFTIVQHSGYGYKDSPQFERGLEVRTLSTDTEVRLVERVGGVVFTSASEAETTAEKWMYPPDAQGIIPQAIGSFSDKMIDNLRIYIPVRKVIG